MAEAGNALLPLLYPDFYAKMLPIERRQAMANMLLQQGSGDPGNAKFGGLRNAGNMLAGALLGRSSDRQLGELYSGPQSPGIHDTGQVTNDPQPQPDLQGNVQPQASQLNLYPGVSPDTQGPAPNAPQTRTQALGGALLGQAQPQGATPQTPQATPAAPVNDGGLPVLPGLSKQSSMMLLLTNPGEYLSAVTRNAAPTDFQKIVGQVYHPGSPQYQAAMQAYAQKQTTPDSILQAQYAANGDNPQARGYAATQFQTPEQRNAAAAYPGDPKAQQGALQAQVNKAGDILARPGMTIIGANGQRFSVPDAQGNMTVWTPNGPIQISIPNAINNAANRAGQVTQATEANTIKPYTVGGNEGVPLTGAQALHLSGQQVSSAPQDGNYQPVPGFDPAAPKVPFAQGQGPQPAIGQSPGDRVVSTQTGDAVVNLAKARATTDAVLSAIDHALSINDKVPNGAGIGAEAKEYIGRKTGGSIYGDAALYGTQWDQDVGVSILGGLKQLQGLGRLDLPEVNQVINTYGLDKDNTPAARKAGLLRLKDLVKKNVTVAQQTVGNLQAPNAAQPPQAATPQAAPTALPDAARAQLREDAVTTFRNGQKWKLQNGQPVQVQ